MQGSPAQHAPRRPQPAWCPYMHSIVHWGTGEHKPAPCECGRKGCVWSTDARECLGFSKKVRASIKKRQKEEEELSWQPIVTEYSEIYDTCGYTCGRIFPFKAEPSPLWKDATELQIQALIRKHVRRARSHKRDLSTSTMQTVRADQRSTAHKAKLSLSQHGRASLSGMRATRAPERSELSELPAAMASAYFRGLSTKASPTIHGCDQLLGTTEFPAN